MKVKKVKSLKIWNNIIKIAFALFAVYKIILMFYQNDFERLFTVVAVFLVILVPFLVRKILHYDLKESTEFIYLMFILLAHILGSVQNWYSKIPWWDLFVHGLSGALTCYIAYLFLKESPINPLKHKTFTIFFMLIFSLAVASCWEFMEFTMDKVSGSDTQWVQTSGVDDTMTDMLIAFFGSSIYSLGYGLFKEK